MDTRRKRGGAMIVAAAIAGIVGCAPRAEKLGPAVDLLAPEQIKQWRLTPTYRDEEPWTLADGVFQGSGSWVGHSAVFADFVLECEFLFADQQGGIVIRGSRASREPWRSGYELDIDWAEGRTHGHIHFPVHPQPYAGAALFEPGVWHTVRIEARGKTITVFLDGKRALRFTSDQFLRGQICLEGEKGGVQYRSLRVSRIGS